MTSEKQILIQTTENISKAIAKLIAEGNVKKTDIADKTGLSINTVNNLIAGKNPTLSSIILIADCLGMNIKQLIQYTEDYVAKFPSSEYASVSSSTLSPTTLRDKSATQSPSQLAMRTGTTTEKVNELVKS